MLKPTIDDERRINRRDEEFRRISSSLQDALAYKSSKGLVGSGDASELLKRIPDNSISLILTDPPYHATKKHNIVGDRDFQDDQQYLDWLSCLSSEWKRILKPNGSLFCFCDSSMAARLEVEFSSKFNVLAHVVWTKPNDPGFDGWKGKMRKEALRSWYSHSERIIFAEPAVDGNLFRSAFANYLQEIRTKSGLSQHELTGRIGAFGKVNHGGAVSNWEAGRNTPSREQYKKISEAILATGRVTSVVPFEDIIRVFNVDKTKEFTDVWTFPSVRPYKGKHPAEKPLQLLEHAISSTTLEGDIVLDCFAGSGNTAFASLNLNRRCIAFEIDESWVDKITTRLTYYDRSNYVASPRPNFHTTPAKGTPTLFSFE